MNTNEYILDEPREHKQHEDKFTTNKLYKLAALAPLVGWYLIELRKILVRKLLATRTSLSDGIARADTTSTILALMGSK